MNEATFLVALWHCTIVIESLTILSLKRAAAADRTSDKKSIMKVSSLITLALNTRDSSNILSLHFSRLLIDFGWVCSFDTPMSHIKLGKKASLV